MRLAKDKLVQDHANPKSLLGRYRLVSTLGQGGMGTIWLAVAGGLGEFRKLLVVKELRWDLTRNHRFIEMFMDEAKLAARLNHPNVVQTLEAGAEDERYFLAMEFLDGQPLSEVMQRAALDPLLSLPVRLRIVCDALAGLHYAHELREYDGTELQIVHRDVSPHNIFVTYDGQVKVVDFGIAKAADAETLTQPGMFKGKFAYASPEQIESRGVDRRADIFAMGVILWELITLNRFAKGKPTQESFEARLAGREPRLSELGRDIDPLLAEICDRAIDVDPRMRYATADQMRLAIEQYLFLSGERVDGPALAKTMRTVFSAERATMHRLIDNHLKAADCSESLVRQLRPSAPSTLSEQDPTTVADLSELAETSRSDPMAPQRLPVSSAPDVAPSAPARSKSGWLWLVAAVAAVVIALTVLAWQRQSAPVAVPLPPDPPADAPEVAAAASPEPAEVEAEPAPTEPKLSRESLRERSEPVVEREREEVREERRERRQATRNRGAVQREASSALALGFGLGGGDDEADEAPAPEPPAPQQADDEEVSAGSLRVDIPELGAKDAPSAEFGEDLRELRGEQRRTIDTEDPFE